MVKELSKSVNRKQRYCKTKSGTDFLVHRVHGRTNAAEFGMISHYWDGLCTVDQSRITGLFCGCCTLTIAHPPTHTHTHTRVDLC